MNIAPIKYNFGRNIKNVGFTSKNTTNCHKQNDENLTKPTLANLQAMSNISFGKLHKDKDEVAKTLKKLAKNDPEAFKKLVVTQDRDGANMLHFATPKKIEVMAKHAPEEFRKAMLMQDKHGSTPLYYADAESAKAMAKHAPEEFKKAMLMYNNCGSLPLHHADKESAKVMAKYAPEEFLQACFSKNKYGNSPFKYANDGKTIALFNSLLQ